MEYYDTDFEKLSFNQLIQISKTYNITYNNIYEVKYKLLQLLFPLIPNEIEFPDNDEIRNLVIHHNEYIKTWSPEDIELFYQYGHGGGNTFINKFLTGQITVSEREIITNFPLNRLLYAEYSSNDFMIFILKRMEYLIRNAPRNEFTYITYRGLNKIYPRTEVSTTFVSTSLSKIISLLYSGSEEEGEENAILEEITVLPKTPGLYISAIAQDGSAEVEIVFPPGININIIASTTEKQTFLNMEGEDATVQLEKKIFFD